MPVLLPLHKYPVREARRYVAARASGGLGLVDAVKALSETQRTLLAQQQSRRVDAFAVPALGRREHTEKAPRSRGLFGPLLSGCCFTAVCTQGVGSMAARVRSEELGVSLSRSTMVERVAKHMPIPYAPFTGLTYRPLKSELNRQYYEHLQKYKLFKPPQNTRNDFETRSRRQHRIPRGLITPNRYSCPNRR